MRKLAIVLGGASLLISCQSAAPPPPPAAMVDPNDPRFAPAFLAHAASGDYFEIQSGQLALQRSQNAAVRNFANMLIADHARLSQALAAAATAAGLTPPLPTSLPHHQATLDRLRSSMTFDQDFQQAQINAHQQALQLMQNYAAGGDLPALRTAASRAIPTIQMHLQQAQMLNTAPPTVPPPPPPRPGERG